MAFDPVTAVANVVNTVLNRVLPDKTANDAAKAQLLQMQLGGDIASVTGQIDIDKAEAASSSTFVAGWRPFVGWICGGAFGYVYIIQPFLQFLLVAFKVNFDASKLPQLNISEMMPVLLGMLGLGAMRSYDKTQGTGSGH